jgi:2-hydroxychromene-2-carboxylate isomerase
VEFWFDLSSPYAYFAMHAIDGLAARHGRTVLWRPFLLGVAYQVTGMQPLTAQNLRGDYARRDWLRLARLQGVPFVLPEDFPMRTQAAARMVYAIGAEDPERAAALVRALFRAAFGEGAEIGRAEIAADVGTALGLDRAELLAVADDPRWKAALRERCDEAVSKGIFGSPFVIVDGEPFWGADRLPMVDLWLTRGGW